MPKRRKDVILFDAPPVISAWGSAGGKKEGEGPLASAFDYLTQDAAFADENCANWEQAESMLQQKAAGICLRKAGIAAKDVDLTFAGDLQAQCTASNYTMRELGIPFAGVYGACSTMAETLARRAAEYEAARRGEKPDGPQNQFATLPDLLLIDGGKGQVGAVKQALRGTALEHVPTFGMVKDDHHRTRAIVDDEGGEIAINRNRNIFTFVTNIQDETHRYANDYRKRAMKKKSYAATLTAIPGVGEKTSAALLAHFKTVAAVKAASISDLEEVKGISHAKAEMLYNALRNGV